MTHETLIDASRLAQLLGQPAIAVVDCRFDLAAPDAGRAAYLRGHIPGARYADLNRDLAGPVTVTSGRHPLPAPDTLAARLGLLGIDAATQVIAYDESAGAFAARLWWLLRWLGHARVAVLEGGLRAWIAANGALQSGDVAPGRSTFVPQVAGDSSVAAQVTTAEVARIVAAPSAPGRLIVDARAAERFAGSVEPIDPVAGHVPGAVNHPFSDNLAPDGTFLPVAELRRRWLARLGAVAPCNVIVMCGSGVTACHDLLSLEVAGLGGARLYAGSWSEWIRDPRRPVARGGAP